jgi:hypothetical protein
MLDAIGIADVSLSDSGRWKETLQPELPAFGPLKEQAHLTGITVALTVPPRVSPATVDRGESPAQMGRASGLSVELFGEPPPRDRLPGQGEQFLSSTHAHSIQGADFVFRVVVLA